MGGVRPLSNDDLPRLAEIHLAAFGHVGNTPAEVERGYVDLLPSVFLDHSDTDHASPSLVFEHEGAVVGFVLVTSRQVRHGDDRIWLASTSHLAVDPEARASLAAIHLMRAITEGPQDLTYVDRSNEASRATLQAAGFVPMPNYSLQWKRMLRPGVSASRRLADRFGGRADFLVGLGRRAESAMPDSLRTRAVPDLPQRPPTLSSVPLTIDHVVTAGPRLMERYELRPLFNDSAVIEREWDLHARARPNSLVARTALVSRRGDVVGWYIADIDADGVAQVLQFVARPEHQRAVFVSMLHDLDEREVDEAIGDLPMSLLYDVEGTGCRLSSDLATTSVHASDDRLIELFRHNRAWLSAIEGEFLLNPPAAVRC